MTETSLLVRACAFAILISGCGGSSTPASGSSTTAASATPPPLASTEHPESRQTLTNDRIRAEIAAHRAEVERCYAASFERSPSHRGSVLVFFEIGPNGRVLRSNVVTNDSGDEEVGTCLVAVVSAIRFPETGLGIMETRYAFDFRAIDRDGDGID